jgi:hypothetical protein
MLHVFFTIIKLCCAASWPLSGKDATRWNVAVRFPDTADCSLRRRLQEGATPPATGRAARCVGELSAPSDTCCTTLCISALGTRKFRITIPSHSWKFLSPFSANCASYMCKLSVQVIPFLQPLRSTIDTRFSPPPPLPLIVIFILKSVVDATHNCKLCSKTGRTLCEWGDVDGLLTEVLLTWTTIPRNGQTDCVPIFVHCVLLSVETVRCLKCI